jgi:hypothetical protein
VLQSPSESPLAFSFLGSYLCLSLLLGKKLSSIKIVGYGHLAFHLGKVVKYVLDLEWLSFCFKGKKWKAEENWTQILGYNPAYGIGGVGETSLIPLHVKRGPRKAHPSLPWGLRPRPWGVTVLFLACPDSDAGFLHLPQLGASTWLPTPRNRTAVLENLKSSLPGSPQLMSPQDSWSHQLLNCQVARINSHPALTINELLFLDSKRHKWIRVTSQRTQSWGNKSWRAKGMGIKTHYH